MANLPSLPDRITALLKAIGVPGRCKGCAEPILWVKHLNGSTVPYTYDGVNHFVDCPNAANFKKGGTRG